MAKLVNFLLGVVTGALVSGVVVTLFAPSSGIELQDQIKGYVHNMQDEVDFGSRNAPPRDGRAVSKSAEIIKKYKKIKLSCSDKAGEL